MSVLDNFDQWKSFLGDRLEQAQGKGLDGRCGIRYGISCWRLPC